METNNRFSGASWYPEMGKKRAVVVGLGATGSWASLFLARAGINTLNLIDPDYFEYHNVGSQLVHYQQIGVPKVQAAFNNINNLVVSDIDIFTSIDTIENRSGLLHNSDFVFSMTDSMDVRKFIFEKFRKSEQLKSLLIDTRISAEYWEIYAVQLGNESQYVKYEQTLFSDSEGYTGDCNYQQSSHSAAGAAIKAVELCTNHLTNIEMDDDYLPFKITNDIRTQNYNVIY